MCKYFDPKNQIIFIFNEFEGKSCKKSSGIFAKNRIFFCGRFPTILAKPS